MGMFVVLDCSQLPTRTRVVFVTFFSVLTKQRMTSICPYTLTVKCNLRHRPHKFFMLLPWGSGVRRWKDAGGEGVVDKGREKQGRKQKGKCCWSSTTRAPGVGLWRAVPWALSSRPVTSVRSTQIKTSLGPPTHSLHVTCPERYARWLCLHDSGMTAGVLILKPFFLLHMLSPQGCLGWRQQAELLSLSNNV